MITKEFCEQYVSLIPMPAKRLTEAQMLCIVIFNKHVPDTFTEENITKLYGGNRPSAQIYLFITQNQHLWVDSNL
jgi:hypothetical protein